MQASGRSWEAAETSGQFAVSSRRLPMVMVTRISDQGVASVLNRPPFARLRYHPGAS